MSETPVVASPVAPAVAPKQLTALETVEQEVSAWLRQKEAMIENIKSIDGAIQGGQRLLGILKNEAAKAEAAAKAELEKVASEVAQTL